MPQCHDGIQAGGLERREIAEDHPHERREEKGDQDDPPVEDEGHVEHCRKPQRSAKGQGDADEAADGGGANSRLMTARWRSLNGL